eukprot:CAMPEP_0194268212 /NCGR_PEP_ID=MMETSP0169-20130528/2574_1 /TAXON_ID=218684 /ORGANISM="Corethron pennatum, Strain L29A3" /LENGTH=292 /DNA_ID=CAMNT_0039009351 /DNA_START=80 /DNA_END=955 /DNA_ORIENTATION=-
MTPCMLFVFLCVAAGTIPCVSAAVSVRLVSGDGPSSPLSEPQPKRRRLQCGSGGSTLGDYNIFIARDLWFANRESAVTKYGEIGTWGTCGVTSFFYLFRWKEEFNDDISQWDTRSVTSISGMFKKASFFNGELNEWDTSNVEFFGGMFDRASSFNGELNGWDTSNVENMNGVFAYAFSFNQDLSGWSVQAVTTMYRMFSWASSFNQELSGWLVHAVEDMYAMFYGASSFDRCLMWDTEGKDTEVMFLESPGRICHTSAPPTSVVPPTSTPSTLVPSKAPTTSTSAAITINEI